MKLRFTPRAVQDLTEIAEYIRTENPRAAEHVRAAIFESLQSLVLFPGLGRLQSTENVRKLVTRRYRYLVYYSNDETAGEIVVLAIQHPARERMFAED
jgi:plasmid stabilization system protein ParE